jgi:hypothetical protein
MWRKLLWTAVVLLTLLAIPLTGIVFSIRSGLQRFSDDAIARFPGDRVEALIRLVDCDTCSLQARNHAVWALGQMSVERAAPVLLKYYDGERCDHSAKLCQKELRKAISMAQTRNRRQGSLARVVDRWHQPWRY